MKSQLIFDVTDANTIADSDNVGAYLRAGTDGDLISSGNGDSDNVSGGFEGIDTRGFIFGYDSVGDNWDRLQSTGGALYVNVANTISVEDAALANSGIANASNALGAANTAEDVVVSPLVDRKYLYVYNNGNRKIYVGASGVSAANGFPVFPGSYIEMRVGASVDVEWVGPNTSQEIRTLELS